MSHKSKFKPGVNRKGSGNFLARFRTCGRREKLAPGEGGGKPVVPEHERLFKLESVTLPALERALAAIDRRMFGHRGAEALRCR